MKKQRQSVSRETRKERERNERIDQWCGYCSATAIDYIWGMVDSLGIRVSRMKRNELLSVLRSLLVGLPDTYDEIVEQGRSAEEVLRQEREGFARFLKSLARAYSKKAA